MSACYHCAMMGHATCVTPRPQTPTDGELFVEAYQRFRSQGYPHQEAQELANKPENRRRG